MPAIAAGPEIERLIQLLARLPGLGPRSARRAALFLIKKREALMAPLAAALQTAIDKIEVCKICGNIDTQNPCTVCTDPRRDPCRHRGGRRRRRPVGARARPRHQRALPCARRHALPARRRRAGRPHRSTRWSSARTIPRCSEIILALNATVDGQSTAHYITDLLHDAKVKVTRLAHGVPVGGELDYLDEGTLAAAIRSRTPF